MLLMTSAWSVAQCESQTQNLVVAPSQALPATQTTPFKLTWYFELTPRYFVGRNDINQSFLDPQTNTRAQSHFLLPSLDSDYASIYIATEQTLAYRLGQQTGQFNIMLDSGEIYRNTASELDPNTDQVTSDSEWHTNGQSVADEFQSTYFLRKLVMTHRLDKSKHMALTVGKGNPIVGNGLVYNDYSPMASITLNSQDIWNYGVELEAMMLSVTNDLQPSATTISQLQLSLRTPSAGTWRIMGAYFNDHDQNLAAVFKQWLTTAAAVSSRSRSSAYAGRPALFVRTVELRSSGHVTWAGVSYDQSWTAGHRFWFNAYLSRGLAGITLDAARFNRLRSNASRLGSQIGQVDERFFSLDLNGWAFQGGGYIYLARDWYLSPFCIGISGDDGLNTLLDSDRQSGSGQRFGGFIGVVPYLEQTNIFFNGGLGHHFSGRTMSLSGLAGRGVLAAGVSASGSLWTNLSYQGGPAILRAMYDGPVGTGKNYGLEINQALTYTVRPDLTLSIQFDTLRTGNFFTVTAWNSQTTVQMSYAPTNSASY